MTIPFLPVCQGSKRGKVENYLVLTQGQVLSGELEEVGAVAAVLLSGVHHTGGGDEQLRPGLSGPTQHHGQARHTHHVHMLPSPCAPWPVLPSLGLPRMEAVARSHFSSPAGTWLAGKFVSSSRKGMSRRERPILLESIFLSSCEGKTKACYFCELHDNSADKFFSVTHFDFDTLYLLEYYLRGGKNINVSFGFFLFVLS